ncbi:hypothetical protein B0H14DRAFT_2598002 [Mycena olivaceomarginata]|nr:hypothetical protein B0H14DRAFT_2598002 [Mycena olivaceomarginata]
MPMEWQTFPVFDPLEPSYMPQMFPVDMDLDDNQPSIPMSQLLHELGPAPADVQLSPEETRAVLEQEFQHDLPKTSDEPEDDDDLCFDADLLADGEYFPYPNKTMGEVHVDRIKLKKKLQLASSVAPERSKSYLGNVFYMNDIRETIARDMANLLVAPHMHFYPEETDGPISETYQAERWIDIHPPNSHRCTHGVAVILDRGNWHDWQMGDMSSPIPGSSETGGRWLLHREKRRQSKRKTWSSIDLHDGEPFVWVDGTDIPAMPNPMRKLVGDDEEPLRGDGLGPGQMTSPGIGPSSINKHMNMCAGNGCLPGRLLQQEYHVHYISTSPNASSAEQFSTFRDHVKSTEKNPVKCFNAVTKRNSRFILRTPGLTGDNPQQSDEASHMGGNTNFPCRKCGWGRTRKEKEGDTLYHTCHLVGITRNAAEIRETLDKQLQHAMHGDAKAVGDLQRDTGTKDKITQHWIEQLLARAKDLKAERRTRTPTEIAAELQKWFDDQPGDNGIHCWISLASTPLRTPLLSCFILSYWA